MLTRDYLIQNKEIASDKAKGSLCGLAIGDSFGDAARGQDNQRDLGLLQILTEVLHGVPMIQNSLF